MDNDASYEIFKKQADNTTVLVEAVKGIDEARHRVAELNAQGGNEYFIFDPLKAAAIEPSEPAVAIDPFAP